MLSRVQNDVAHRGGSRLPLIFLKRMCSGSSGGGGGGGGVTLVGALLPTTNGNG